MGLTIGCADDAPTTATSPLLGGDTDHLWILIRAARVGDARECAAHYLKPDDPRFLGVEKKCDAWTRDFADYLSMNGFPTVEHQHLKEPMYWQWFVDKKNAIQECRNHLGVLPIPSPAERREEHYRLRNACDPFGDARNNRKLTPVELGIRYP